MTARPFGGKIIRLTPTELAERWQVSERTLGRWRVLGDGPAWMMLNGRVRYAEDDVQAFEQRGRRENSIGEVRHRARLRRLTS